MNYVQGAELADNGPAYLVFDLPTILHLKIFMGLPFDKPRRVILPVLSVQGADKVPFIPEESLSWAESLIEKDVPTPEIRRCLNSVGRLFEFSQIVLGGRIVGPEAIDLVVWAYLRARVENPTDPSRRIFAHWHPVQYETVRTEFRDIVDFARYCVDYIGPSSIFASMFQSTSSIWTKVDRRLSGDDFLAHLEGQRARWHFLLGEDRLAPPSRLRKLARRSSLNKSANNTSLSSDEIDSLISLERNPVFRALWILLAFVGPRISEALNLWRCDILDSSYAKPLFRAKVDGPLVIFADPRHSLYTGSFDLRRSIQTRQEYLETRFGLKPRPDDECIGQRAGWKGMSIFNPEFSIAHGTWTCRKRASEFTELAAEIQDLSSDARNDSIHPYFFVNSKNAEYFGDPQKPGNVEKAFDRALVRAGIEPHSDGAHLHGLRHYYRWYAKHELGHDDETIQLMLRQKDLKSQRVYGKRASDINDAMNKFHDAQGT